MGKIGKKLQNQKKNTFIKAPQSTIRVLLILMSLVFLLPFLSAEETLQFDNVKQYDADLQKVTVVNTFGIGRTIADIKLDTPKVNYVPYGKNKKIAEVELTLYEDYTDIVNNIKTYNSYDLKIEINREFSYKLITYEQKTVISENGTKTIEISEIQTPIEKMDFLAGTYKIGIFTDVYLNDNVEWIPTLFGVRIDEWAVWISDSDIINGLTDLGASNTASVFSVGGNYFLINGWSDGKLYGYHWNGTGWALNSSVNSTYPIPSGYNTPNTFWINGSLYLLIGDGDGTTKGGVWNGNGFTPNNTINNSIIDYGSNSYPSVFQKDGIFYLINTFGWSGSSTPLLKGYNWNGTGWTLDTNIINGLPINNAGGLDGEPAVSVFNISDKYHLIFGNTTGLFTGYSLQANGTWLKNLTLSQDLPDIGAYARPNVFLFNDDYFYIIAGTSTGGSYGYKGFYFPSFSSPSVTLDAPDNYANLTNPTIMFNTTVYEYNEGGIITNVTFYIDGVLNETNTDGTNGTYSFIKTLSEGSHNWSILAYNNNSLSNQSETRELWINTTPLVTLDAPEDYANLTYNNIYFNTTVYSVYDIANVSFYLNGTLNETDTSGTNGTYNFNKYLVDGYYNWSIVAYSSLGGENTSETRTLTVDATAPILSTTGIQSLYNSTSPINLTWYLNNSDANPDKCWYYTSDNSTNITVTCNSTTITNFTLGGTKIIYYFGNDTIGNEASGSATLFIGYYPYTQSTDKTSVGSGDSVVFTLYINGTDVSTQFSSTNATLNFNGTSYAPDTTDRTNANYTKFTKTLYMTIGNTTGAETPYNWTYNIMNTTDIPLNVTTTNQTINVYSMTITDCGITAGRYILNLSIKDEELNSLINASLNATVIEVDINVSSRVNTSASWNFSKKWINNNTVAVCVPDGILTYSSYRIDFTIGYKAEDYVQEFYYMDNGTIDSTNYLNSYTINPISLYDLPIADSTTFLFSFKDENNIEVEDALVHVYRKYIGDGIFREVERAKQDDNGETHVHLVEEDVIYYFVITQYGHIIYTSSQYNAKCLDTPCQIELTASTTFVEFPDDYDLVNGTIYTITSDKTARTTTLTFSSNGTQTVNFSVYRLVDGVTVEYINTTSTTATDGALTLYVPSSYGNVTFFASIFANGEFIRSEWIDMRESARDYFGTTGAILGGLLVLTLIFMAISEGIILIIIGIIAVFLIVGMQLVDMSWMAIISIIIAGGLIIYKIRSGGNRR